MPRKKPYFDGCATAHALDLIGERWALLIVRELIPGPKRFSDLKAALPGISANILTNRLAELEAVFILRRRQLPPPAASQVYALTNWGAELEPIICSIGRWAARSPTLEPGKPMSPASVLLSLRTMFSPDKAKALCLNVAVRMEGVPYRAVVNGGEFSMEIGEMDAPDVTVSGDHNLLAALIYGGLALEDAMSAGLDVSGSRAALERFVGLFPLPPIAEVQP